MKTSGDVFDWGRIRTLLVERQRSLDITVRELGELSGINFRTFQNFKDGHSRALDPDNLVKAAAWLGVGLGELMLPGFSAVTHVSHIDAITYAVEDDPGLTAEQKDLLIRMIRSGYMAVMTRAPPEDADASDERPAAAAGGVHPAVFARLGPALAYRHAS